MNTHPMDMFFSTPAVRPRRASRPPLRFADELDAPFPQVLCWRLHPVGSEPGRLMCLLHALCTRTGLQMSGAAGGVPPLLMLM